MDCAAARKSVAKLYIEEMDGEGWRSLSVNARRMYDALICQHFRYCQRSNGELQISYSGFQRAGIPNRREVSTAKKELIASGKIEAKQGFDISPDLKPPTLFELTSYCKPNGYLQNANRAFVWVPLEVIGAAFLVPPGD
jgi:hypothetical protein